MLVLREPITTLHNFTFQWNFSFSFEESKATDPLIFYIVFDQFPSEKLFLNYWITKTNEKKKQPNCRFPNMNH